MVKVRTEEKEASPFGVGSFGDAQVVVAGD